MRTKTIARWRKAILAGALAVSLGSQAQQEQAAQPAAPEQQPAAQVQQPRPETAPVVTEQGPRPPPDTTIQPVPGAPEEYVIQKGDTLWDLSQKFLNNPWYWPKIWSNNPYIENPHWIYPGNKLRIIPGEGGQQAPAQVQAPPEPGVEAANAPPEEAPAVSEAASPDLDVVKRSSKESRASNNSVSVSGKLAFTPPPVVTVRASGLVSPDEMAEAGSIAASFEEREMLTTFDTAYVKFRGGGEPPCKQGDKMILFRPDGEIKHPLTGRKLADKTKTVGVVNVLSIKGDVCIVQVERVFDEIARGDLARPWSPQDKRVTPRANNAEVSGVIVSAVNPGLTTYGEANEVFIDKGSADGVQEGNTFAVVRRGDGLSNVMVVGSYTAGEMGEKAAKVQTPDENVGLLLVVDTKEHLSTAVVIKSVRELQAGDHVEMHATGAGGGVN
jgi:nucleoid-associated protein YgaU